MASITPRASGLCPNTPRMNSLRRMEADEEVDTLLESVGEGFDARTPLDRTIDRIGMGSYQWSLLSLCGFGWMADNMWIQAVAVILPRVQQHFSVSDQYIGTLSSSLFGGMMFGAVGWGTCSDLLGRTTAFNATLLLTALFGILASFANSFPSLCIGLFFLGSAVGGSMPTDGTLLLEHMPNGKQYLVTALSIFFSLGAVLAAVVGLLVIPSHSCPPGPGPCDVNTDNMGWKYLLIVLGIITLSMFLARIAFFRLHESPRYLVHAGRPEEAIVSLQLISKFNGSELSLGLDDVVDHVHPPISHGQSIPGGSIHAPFLPIHDITRGRTTISTDLTDSSSSVLFEADTSIDQADNSGLIDRTRTLSSQSSRDTLRNSSPDSEPKDYSSTASNHTAKLQAKRIHSESSSLKRSSSSSSRHVSPTPRTMSRERPRVHNGLHRPLSITSLYEVKPKWYSRLPRWLRRPLWAWADRVAMVLSPEWLRTTVLVWAVWCSMSLAYTMFNVYLPKLLERRSGLVDGSAPRTLTSSLWDVVIYAIGGCPGAILGAYMVETPLGRRWSLASSTFVTAFFCAVFAMVQNPWAVRASTVGLSLSATTMWAVLYGWTPEIFGTKVRGTACGIASALSRIGGMIAPLLGGTLLMIDDAFPVYASLIIFVIAGVCVLLLREDEGDRGGDRVLIH